VLTPTLSTLPSRTLCELWLDDCVRHKWTTFHPQGESNLQSLFSVGVTLSLARRATKPGHLRHSVHTCPPGANARRLKSRNPLVPAAQQLISSSDNNNIRAADYADHQWNAKWADNPRRLRIFNTDTVTPPAEWPSHEQPASVLTASALSSPACINGVWPPPQLISSSTTTYVRHSGRITDGMCGCLKTLRDSVLPSPTPASILLEWPF